MAHFFFNVRDARHRLLKDRDGMDLPDVDAARAEALAGARGILAEKVAAGQVIDGETFEICDEEGSIVAVVPFRNALRLS